MNWTTATMEWDDNQTQLRDVDVIGLSVWGDHNYCILITAGY